MATLNLRVDPSQMVSGADRAEDALKGVQRQAKQTESAVDRMAASGGRSTVRMGGAVQGMGARMQAARGQIQNTAFQIGDFATQVGAGTSASVALGQQLPQLLGGFGALGAVMGAVVAVGVPLLANFIDLGSSAGDLSKQLDGLEGDLDTLATATERVAAANSLTGDGVDELIDRYGALTTEVTALLEAQRQISILEATQGLRNAQEQLSDFLSVGLMDSLAGFGANARGRVRLIQHELDISREAAEQLKAALDAVEAAEGPRELETAFSNVRAVLVDVVGGWENLTDEQIAFISNINAAQDSAGRLASLLFEGSEAAEEISVAVSGIDLGSVISQADTLVAKFAAAASSAWDVVAAVGAAADRQDTAEGARELLETERDMLAAGEDRVKIEGELAVLRERQRRAADGLSGPLLDIDLDKVRETAEATAKAREEIIALRRAASKKGGGGGASEVDKLQQSYERLIGTLDPLVRAEQQLAAAQDTITAAMQAGIITAEEAARAYGLAEDEYAEMIERARDGADELSDAAEFASDSLSDLFSSALRGGAEFSDMLARILSQLADMLLNSAFDSLISGSSGGGFGGFIGGLLGFDGGGFTGHGARIGGVDGKGGFPAILHPNETVIDHTRAANSNAGGGVVEVVARVENGSIVQDVRRISGEVAVQTVREGLAAYDRMTLPGSVNRIRNDPTRRG